MNAGNIGEKSHLSWTYLCVYVLCCYRRLKGTLKAQWEETLTFNELLSHFTSNQDAVIFFELLDFVTVGVGRGYSESEQKPWHRIAWAFLRPSGKTCRSRLGKRIRLQLYKYPRKIFGRSTEGSEARTTHKA